MSKLFIAALLPVTLCISDFDACRRTEKVTDVSIRQEIVIKKRDCQKTVHSLSVIGKGRINGVAKVALMLGEEEFDSKEIENKIEFQFGGEWYADDAKILYIPETASEGSFKIRYIFNEL